jgi:hypothetical protein
MGADETQIEASFSAAISTAREQKRAEGTYAEYRRQKSKCVRRTWIPTTYLLASRSALPFVQQAGKAELMQWLLYR